jgi:hypothetical protein
MCICDTKKFFVIEVLELVFDTSHHDDDDDDDDDGFLTNINSVLKQGRYSRVSGCAKCKLLEGLQLAPY